VRLYQGDYAQETVFSENPLEVALHWQALGAPRIHIVDLDGAASGDVVNWEVIESIATAVLVPVQLGGGIRRLATIERVLKLGIERVILGTIAVEDPELVKEACRRFQEFIVVSIDARDGRVATHGWRKGSQLKAVTLAREMARSGVRRFIYTDISRDGTLVGPNFAAISELIEAIHKPVVAAGGISDLSHLKLLKKIGADGAIIGKALYVGDIDLKQALEEAQ
jgi:phosphoribosylformimino-5-aminoimidazole carboxamide ribotide isomerase